MIYYLSLGANIGEREATINRAIHLIEQQIGRVLRCSSFYYSEPWGFESEHDFCNQCCSVETELGPIEVLHTTQSIERAIGRTHKSIDGHYQDRVIDIDIISGYDDAGDEIVTKIEEPSSDGHMINILTLPHPLWQQRDFVRIPLAEIKE
ncbi:MAG: 2-amino-4-hydroxy-6-hydroxymethyldihydropteridine diphosphokinase [Paludibacteraceae bacterium]|nr:2-amino-4-hydroxy-6-hydroxymethyldihydropteridine diphosphokinase [Paludibacteraceae bacterium]